MSVGYLYILTNDLAPDVVYIGMTGPLGAREIDQDPRYADGSDPRGKWQGFPGCFWLRFELYSENVETHMVEVERVLIRSRVNRSPHFFRVSFDEAVKAVLGAVLEMACADVDMVTAYPEELVDQRFLDACAEAYDLHRFDIVSAIGMADPELIRPAIERYRAWKTARVAIVNAQRESRRDAEANGSAGL
jgi:hypothetical protein